MSRYTLPDPKCRHKATVRVSSHRDLAAAHNAEEEVASTYCCDRAACREDADQWVKALTGLDAVTVELCKSVAAA